MISPAVLAEVADVARRDASAAGLRQHFPELHFSECSEDEVSPRYRPALCLDTHALYLISGATGHCLTLTHDAEIATGILVAAKADDA
jgi:hypothetical protein